MKLSEINPTEDLKNILIANGVKVPIYAKRDRPTASLPEVFIEILSNGLARQITTKRGLVTAGVALTINVKNQDDGTANTVIEQKVLVKIQDIFDNPVRGGLSVFTLAPNLIANGISQTLGYSYKMLNFEVDIYPDYQTP